MMITEEMFCIEFRYGSQNRRNIWDLSIPIKIELQFVNRGEKMIFFPKFAKFGVSIDFTLSDSFSNKGANKKYFLHRISLWISKQKKLIGMIYTKENAAIT